MRKKSRFSFYSLKGMMLSVTLVWKILPDILKKARVHQRRAFADLMPRDYGI